VHSPRSSTGSLPIALVPVPFQVLSVGEARSQPTLPFWAAPLLAHAAPGLAAPLALPAVRTLFLRPLAQSSPRSADRTDSPPSSAKNPARANDGAPMPPLRWSVPTLFIPALESARGIPASSRHPPRGAMVAAHRDCSFSSLARQFVGYLLAQRPAALQRLPLLRHQP
jgi:hypothetical protein